MKRKLTTKLIESLPPATGKRYEARDTLIPGLHLRVSATGGKVWNLSTRVDRRNRRIKLGSYPALSLSDARERARDVLRDIDIGTFEKSDAGSPEAPVPTLGEVIPQFIELHAKPRNRDWKGTESILTKFAAMNSTPMDQIKRADVHRVLDTIIADGAPTRANRALAAIKKLMNWCIDRGIIETSPVAALKPPTKEVARERVLTDTELAACLNAATDEGFPFEAFLQLLILTGQRRGEVAGMRWAELDLDKGLWTLPAKRTKNASSHIVPLAPLAIDILKSVPRFLDSDLVFTTNGKTPISGFGRLKERLDLAVGLDAEDWRFHDLRRTMATNMAMMRVQPHIIEAILNHKTGIVSGVAAVYNRHAYLDEKREALELWAERVGTLTTAGLSHGNATDDPTASKSFSIAVA
ncbi:MAG: tyrosine-type recombinase/integrase [Pseudomonadota bacterium]